MTTWIIKISDPRQYDEVLQSLKFDAETYSDAKKQMPDIIENNVDKKQLMSNIDYVGTLYDYKGMKQDSASVIGFKVDDNGNIVFI